MLSPANIDLMILGHYKYGGGSVPVLVLHEWLAAHHNHLPMLSYVYAGRFTYLFANLRGYGLSGNFLGDFSAAEAAADVPCLTNASGFESFCLVGHSMSGMIAQRFAADAPDRMNRLLLISPIPASGFKTDEAGFRSMAAIVENQAAAAAAVGARTGYRYGSAWVARKLNLIAAGGQSEPMMGYLRMFTGTDFADEVAWRAQTPVCVLVDEHDMEAYREATTVKNFGPFFLTCLFRSREKRVTT
ncbi:MAG: alpha/beta hydrolase [Pseudolabrys sp.]|nr:alpha/beta hydrolase [Pseudolabrys sp.]